MKPKTFGYLFTATIALAACGQPEESRDTGNGASSSGLPANTKSVATHHATKPSHAEPEASASAQSVSTQGTPVAEPTAAHATPGATVGAAEKATPTPPINFQATPMPMQLTPMVPTPQPVSDTTAAKLLALRQETPSSQTEPRLISAGVRELDRAEKADITIIGFNLKNCQVVLRSADEVKKESSVTADTSQNEQLTIPFAEWNKLGAGTYTVLVTAPSGATAELPATITIN